MLKWLLTLVVAIFLLGIIAPHLARFIRFGQLPGDFAFRFRGRQITHSEIGLKVMEDFAERTKDISTVERRPLLEGRHMIMILAPKAEKVSKAERSAAPKREEAPGAAAPNE